MTIKHYTNVSIGPIFDMQVDPNARRGQELYLGEAHTFSAVRVSDTRFELWLHDERTQGGILINPLPNMTDYNNVSMVLGANNVLTITQANGNVVVEDLSALVGPDVHLASLTLVGNTLIATDTDANTFPIDLSSLAFVDEIQLIGNNLTFDFGDGSQTVIDLSGYLDAPDGVINSFTLAGTIATISNTLGQTFNLDMSSLNESLADNGDGTYTFNDGEGGLVNIVTAVPSAALAPGVDDFGTAYTAGDTIVTFPDGSILAHLPASATTPLLGVAEDSVIVQATTEFLNFDGDDFEVTAPVVTAASVRRRHLEPLGAPIVLTTSGLYTPGPDVAAISVQVQGAGGGSTAAFTAAANEVDVGANGWAGAYAQKFIEEPQPANVIVGAGGAAYSVNAQGNAGAGGASRYNDPVGGPIIARGGYGGQYVVIAGQDKSRLYIRRPYAFGFAAGASGGDVNIHSRPPAPGQAVGMAVFGGGGFLIDTSRGGNAPLGRGVGGFYEHRPSGIAGSFNGQSALSGFGSGASGAYVMGLNPPVIGASGRQGVCIIQEYRRV